MFRRILEVFRLRSERRFCLLWYGRDLATIDTLQLSGPGLPAIDLAQTPIHTGALSLVPGEVLAQDRAKRGLKTIRLVPMWPGDYSLLPETVKLPRVKAPPERKK